MYISKPLYNKQIVGLFSFVPFPGTLNVKVTEDLFAIILSSVEERGSVLTGKAAKGGKERLFRVLAQPCRIEGLDAVALFPVKSVHKDEVEIIASVSLREKLGLRDGDVVSVEM